MSSRRARSQDRRRLEEASNTKMNLLIMNLNKSIHQVDTEVMSKQLVIKKPKLIMKQSQEVISVTKFKSNLLILA
jgi:hypothetical protein